MNIIRRYTFYSPIILKDKNIYYMALIEHDLIEDYFTVIKYNYIAT